MPGCKSPVLIVESIQMIGMLASIGRDNSHVEENIGTGSVEIMSKFDDPASRGFASVEKSDAD